MAGKPGLRQAFMASPGPQTWREALVLWLKGIAMGGADVIPGVSGGTIALITGIYTQLVDAIRSLDGRAAADALQLRFSSVLARVHARFLVILSAGIGAAIFGLSHVIHFFLDNYPTQLWSLFFGLIAASVLVLARRIGRQSVLLAVCGLLGFAGGWFFVGIIPVQTPEAPWFIFLCGMAAICAMILPGVSGAFLLLLLGKYAYVTGALKNPFHLDSMMIIIVFGAGCAVGLAGFSRVLHWLLVRWPKAVLALLTGLMAGAMRKVWPWKEVLEETVIRGKTYVLQTRNVWPESLDAETVACVAMMLVGCSAVLALERFSGPAGE